MKELKERNKERRVEWEDWKKEMEEREREKRRRVDKGKHKKGGGKTSKKGNGRKNRQD